MSNSSSDNDARNQAKQQNFSSPAKDSQSGGDEDSKANQCPVCEDIQASIEKTKELLKREQQVLHTGKDKQKLSSLRSEILSSRDANDSLSKRCDEQLLGATGEKVHPEFELALKNLALANRWLESCLRDEVMKKPRLLMAYRAAILTAIRQSERLLKGLAAPNNKSVIAVPKTLADSEAHLWIGSP